MSQWKLVEAQPESPEPNQREQQQAAAESSGGRGGRGRGRGHGRGGRGRGRVYPQRSKADRSYFAYLAVQQIDLIFNPDSLCMDTYVRAYMDEEGYVPIGLVCNYYNVACYGCTYYDIKYKLREVAPKSKFYEVDMENETIRLKQGWEKFLMPNAYGGRGLPKYVKQPANLTHYGDFGEGNVESYGGEAQAEPAEAEATAEAAGSNEEVAAASS